VVEEGNRYKFTKGEKSAELLKKLLETGDRELVEVALCPCFFEIVFC
jgi:predicted NAD-dependent protein-ADP-ribosyltransferase YbiA (DUF1768 family)